MRVLVAGWIGSTNLGDELVFAGLRQLLAEQGAQVAAISRDPAVTRRLHGVGAVADTDVAGLWRAVGSADAMVFGGGGLLQDTTSPFNLPYHLSRPLLARLRGVPVAGLGLGAGALDTRLGRMLVRSGVGRFTALTVRDRESQELLAGLAGGRAGKGVSGAGCGGVELGSDLAFALPLPEVAGGAGAGHGPDDAGVLAVCLRPWSGERGRLPAQARDHDTPQPQVEVLAAGLGRIMDETALKVRFVAFQADRDDAVHRRVASLLPSAHADRVEFVNASLDRVIGQMASATAVVSMRYHGGIAATLAGRPVVLIDYAPKVSSLAEELGPGARLLAWDPDDLARLPTALAAVLDQEQAVVAARDALRRRQEVNRAALAALASAAGR